MPPNLLKGPKARKENVISVKWNTDNDRYSGKNGQGFLFHYSGCFHYSGRLLYGTQHISSPSFQFKNEILTSFTSMVGWGLESCVAIAFKTEF